MRDAYTGPRESSTATWRDDADRIVVTCLGGERIDAHVYRPLEWRRAAPHDLSVSVRPAFPASSFRSILHDLGRSVRASTRDRKTYQVTSTPTSAAGTDCASAGYSMPGGRRYVYSVNLIFPSDKSCRRLVRPHSLLAVTKALQSPDPSRIGGGLGAPSVRGDWLIAALCAIRLMRVYTNIATS